MRSVRMGSRGFRRAGHGKEMLDANFCNLSDECVIILSKPRLQNSISLMSSVTPEKTSKRKSALARATEHT